MFPEGYESLTFEDNIFVARINLCCAAIALLVFAFLDSWEWPGQTAALVAAAGFVYIARQIEWILRRVEGPRERKSENPAPETFPSPFWPGVRLPTRHRPRGPGR
ncbi:MAG TPA: hypothetical protein VG308_07305 [Stellaceae bacterium]|jgi:hypothetical protein|nr:hypothetical protein [Stellaceae bacterium]